MSGILRVPACAEWRAPDPSQSFYNTGFYIFQDLDLDGVQERVPSVDLDGNGPKFLPALCISCHGGTNQPATYRVNGNCNRDCETVFSTNCVIARTVSGPFRNDYIDLYQTFFYDLDAVWRASTIVHEVRHARDRKSHDGCVCGNVSACDFRWSSNGANTYELMWLAAYYWTPEDHPFITPARRERAASLFNTRKEVMFCEKPQWQIGDFWYINETPEYFVEQVACSEDPDHPHYCLILAN